MGYNPGVAWKPARKPGQLSARMHDIIITATANGVLGMPGGGSAAVSITADNSQVLPLDTTSPLRTGSSALEVTAEATGELKVSGAGSSSIEFTASADCIGVLWAEGDADISVAVAGVTIGAIAEIIGVATLSMTGTLVPYAVGNMIGSTTSTGGELTAPQVAAEVVNALLGTTIPVDTKKIAGVLVGGVGTELDPWGPA